MSVKNPIRQARESRFFGPPEAPPRRKVKGKAAKHFLRVAKECDAAADNFDRLVAMHQESVDQYASYGETNEHHVNAVIKYKAKAEEARKNAAEYRKKAGKT